MALTLKEQLDRSIGVINSTLQEMELIYVAIDDVLVALCNLLNVFRHDEVVKAVDHVGRTYAALVKEVGGSSS